ncbi:Re/Si-specific NAD(P)(+) transhydrogenase subunit alpha [Oscillatoria sp. CS-180]|nr:Re/Si-specific NAD(P)(+) transhydrogenase subunit alpha [Oscillatoria sp. CS-180]MDB9528214.1 Re/Si-specific NAD(P)(+) transhydrogenase subunit alpha [Oscillatoria sp. CS-180]
MRLGIPKEIAQGERRVAVTPDTAQKLQKLGFEVWVEAGAGESASFLDSAYQAAGCHVVEDVPTLWAESDIVLKVRSPQWHPDLNRDETELLRPGGKLISFIWPAQNPELLEKLAQKNATVMAMDAVPRITRAQKLDALSSMANLAGYRAVIEAANQFGRGFTGQITAAGKIPPCKVLVIGAGVAGLAAIGTARGLGAIVRAFDTRPAVKEQVQSLGAEFLELHFEEDSEGSGGYAKVMSPAFIAAEMALFAEQAKEVDVIITTALIPGKAAPRLVTQEMVEAMKPGSVVVDMAAEQGGNCEVTRPDEIYTYHGITIVGLTDLASRMANQASQLYGTNLFHLLSDLGGAANHTIDMEDVVVRQSTVVLEGEVTWPAPPLERPAPSKPTPQSVQTEQTPAQTKPNPLKQLIWPLIIGAALFGVGVAAPESFISHFTVFVLAIFLGWKVIWDVTPALHTPLMSVTNAISGIIIIGGMLQISGPLTSTVTVLGAIAIFVSTLNISGGFFVTQRMLNMFHK